MPGFRLFLSGFAVAVGIGIEIPLVNYPGYMTYRTCKNKLLFQAAAV